MKRINCGKCEENRIKIETGRTITDMYVFDIYYFVTHLY